MEDRIRTPRPHSEGLNRFDQSRAAGIYGEVRPTPVAPALPEEAPSDPGDD